MEERTEHQLVASEISSNARRESWESSTLRPRQNDAEVAARQFFYTVAAMCIPVLPRPVRERSPKNSLHSDENRSDSTRGAVPSGIFSFSEAPREAVVAERGNAKSNHGSMADRVWAGLRERIPLTADCFLTDTRTRHGNALRTSRIIDIHSCRFRAGTGGIESDLNRARTAAGERRRAVVCLGEADGVRASHYNR